MHDLKDTYPRDHYKALPPEDTIQRIRDIFHQKGIFVIESNWYRECAYFASLGLTLSDADITSAGKGIDEKYALASSYAEFIERLQNLIIFERNYAGKQPSRKVCFPDGLPLDYQRFKRENHAILEEMFDERELPLIDGMLMNWRDMISYPFYHVSADQMTYLPFDLLMLCVGSNGMCAGNTPEEALIQGLCEILERYVLREIYRNENLVLPLIPEDFFGGSPLLNYFSLLKRNGYEVYAKDCSLGGRVPVVGLLIKKGDRAQFSLGASPDFLVGFERCFTELFQGYQLDSIYNKLRPILPLDTPIPMRTFTTREKRIRYQFFKALTRGEGIVNPLVFNHDTEFNPDYIFRSESVISKKQLQDLLKTIRTLNHEIYIRDVSFLGFPAYFIYVPGMSETSKLNYEVLKLHLEDIPISRRIFYALDGATSEELFFLAKTIEKLLDFPHIAKEAIVKSIHNLSLKKEAILNHVDPESLLHMIYYRLGNITASHTIFKDYLSNLLAPEDFQKPSPFVVNHICLLKFLEYMMKGDDLVEAKRKVDGEFEPRAVAEVYPLLQDSAHLSRYLGIPKCDDCHTCEFGNICDYAAITEFIRKIQDLVNECEFDPKMLKELL
ncbi:MAG: YcaO-like family protein [bacterium]